MSEKYNISDFKGHYHLMPNVIMDVISGDAYKVFSRIYAYGCKVHREPMTNKSISISARVMRKLLKLGFKKINTCITELEDLNFISVDKANKSAAQYTINWKEILYLDSITCNLSYEGRTIIADACKDGNKIVAPSQLDGNFISKVVADYRLDSNEYANLVTDGMESITDESEVSEQKADIVTDDCNRVDKCNHMRLQMNENCNQDYTNCNRMQLQLNSNCNQPVTVPSHYFAEKDEKLVLVINLSPEESLLYKRTGINELIINGQTVAMSTSNCNHMQLQMNPTVIEIDPNCNQIGTFPQKTCKSGYTVNIYNKINKNNKQYERSEYCNIGEELNKTNFLEENLEKDRENFLGEDLGLLKENNQEPSSSSEENIETTHSEAYFQLMKRKANTPFFSQVEIESFVDNIENCLDRPDKIFINRVWSIAKELLVSEWQDEDGKLIEEQIDPEGSVVYQDRLFPDILQPAMEETLEIIEKGYYELNGEKLPVECDNIDPDDIDIIIDFEITHQSDDNYYTLSKYRFRDIYSQLAEKKKKGRTRTEKQAARQQDLDYMKKIILIGDDDKANSTSQLTRPEKAVYCFMDHYAKNIWDDGSFEFDEGEYINRRELNMFFYEISQFGISEQEFLQLVYNRSMQKDTGALMMRERMFDSSAIKRMNAILSEHSIVDDYKI